jgi:nucleoside 2-deoxyribosyltransferase
MAMAFGDAETDEAYRTCFKPAIAQCGFELRRIDEKPPAGLIDNRLRVEIRRSRFLVVDLTHDNRGAYWEAGFAEGLGKPVIYTCETEHFERSGTHFDTNHQHTIVWNSQSFGEVASHLKDTIRATIPAEAKMFD